MKNLKIIVSLFISLSFNNISYSQIFHENGRNQLSLEVSIKSLAETRYDVYEVEKFGDLVIEKDFSSKWIYIFDKEGREINNKMYFTEGNLDREQIIKYDDKGNKIESTNYNSDGTVDTYKFENNDKGKEVRASRYDTILEKWVLVGITEYDNKENITMNSFYDDGGSIPYKFTNKYDADGNNVEENSYKYEKLTRKVKNEFDIIGNISTSYEYNPDGSLDKIYIYKYNKEGNKIEQKEYNSFKVLTYKIKYDLYGNETNIINYKNGTPYSENKIIISYEYDSNNNWIKKTELSTSMTYNSTSVEERIIDYY